MVRLVFSVVVLVASVASAQTVYEPVRTQFGGPNVYFYGGSDPRIHACAEAFRRDGFAFVGDRRVVGERRARVFVDRFGCVDASRFGVTAADVQNEANARLPRYVRKADLRAAAVEFDGGLRVVPADALPVPPERRGTVEVRPTTRRVFVFPKRLLDRPLVPNSRVDSRA